MAQTINNDREVLTFTLSDSETEYSIPMPRSLSAAYARSIRAAMENGEDFTDIFCQILDDFAPGVTDRVTLSALSDLAVLWSDASRAAEGVDLGE